MSEIKSAIYREGICLDSKNEEIKAIEEFVDELKGIDMESYIEILVRNVIKSVFVENIKKLEINYI